MPKYWVGYMVKDDEGEFPVCLLLFDNRDEALKCARDRQTQGLGSYVVLEVVKCFTLKVN